MGFLTRLLAGLTAAAALGTGLTGTANAVDVTGAAGTTKSVVKLADDGGNETSEDTADNPDDDSTDADSTTDAGAQSDAGQQAEIQSSTSQDKATAKSSLPDHIVNGSFDYPACPDGKNSCDVDPTTGWGGFYVDYGRKFMPIPDWDRSKFGWDSSQEGLRPDQQPNSHQKLQHCVQIGNKPNNNGQKMNRFAEIIAETPDEYIYQDIATTPGVMYRWSLKHASEDASHVDSMQVMIGSPGRETAQDATRTTSNGRGDRTGVTSKTIATKGGQAEWETYTGVYVATSTVTRFTFKSAQGRDSTRGNFIDDVMFTKAYKLTYDKNSADASGQVPSNQRGKENTTQPARTRTSGTVRTVADRTASGLTVHDLKKGDIAPAQYGDFKFSTTDGVTADQITDVNGFTVKKNWDPTEENQAYAGILATMYQPNKNGASLVLHHVGQWRDSSGTQRWLNAKITVNDQNLGSLVYLESKHEFRASYGKWDKHPSSRPYMDVTVDFLLDDGSTPQGLRGVTGFTDLDGGTSGYNEGVELVSGFDGAYVRSDAHLARFGTNGWAGTTDENKNNADAHGMKHYVGATFTGSSFHVHWSVASGQARQSGFQPVDSTIAYRLTYNKNAQDASGQVPSNETANTVKQAKAKSSGSVRFAADKTDGKVSDLVQRTTTHEDGSVTVRTVDQSTDVVSGCQVYYPAGQRITLATMAKDDDCWDSSMLSRPGHTQLGWNQDRNATQAQAQVTMVEGGMTVYAAWVGNPVLTYDTNKPSTWSGQMPSTPASVSVPYNAPAADGSGWRAGDTSKLRGYKFLGWYTGPQDNAGLYDWNTLLTGNVTVYAHWQRLQANVVYNANGGTGSHPNTTGWQYSDVTIPGDTSKSFKRDKYVFKGWGTKPGKADVAYKDGSKVALQDKDITLYAQWQEVHENFVETGGIGLPIAIAGGVLLLMFGIGSTVMLTRRMNGHGMPDDE